MFQIQTPASSQHRCNDGNTQTSNGICFSGLCRACPVPTNDCEMAGTFDLQTQQCLSMGSGFKPDGTACDAGGAVAHGSCAAGVCIGVCVCVCMCARVSMVRQLLSPVLPQVKMIWATDS